MNLKKIHLILFLKPYYNWTAFNTQVKTPFEVTGEYRVLNLIITGLPSIHDTVNKRLTNIKSFKPCYKWNTFNTETDICLTDDEFPVLNLVISGIPSILILTGM